LSNAAFAVAQVEVASMKHYRGSNQESVGVTMANIILQYLSFRPQNALMSISESPYAYLSNNISLQSHTEQAAVYISLQSHTEQVAVYISPQSHTDQVGVYISLQSHKNQYAVYMSLQSHTGHAAVCVSLQSHADHYAVYIALWSHKI
jgi:hypothetical protein